MAVNLSPIGGVAAQFLDNSGNPLSGGKIYTYAAGTTTPQATYTSAGGGTPHSNPIILDAAGRVPSGEIWLTDGFQYKFLIKTSADVQIGSYDNIIGINSNFVNYTNSQEIQTATAGQTVFTLTTMAYQPGTNSLSVFVDGVNQYGPGASYAYQETSGTVVTFTAGLHVGAEVKFTTSAINASSYGDATQIAFTGFNGNVGTVSDLAGNTGADLVGFTQSGTGPIPRSIQNKLRETVSVFDFMTAVQISAVQAGTSVEDLSVPFQNAIATEKRVYIPKGTYNVNIVVTNRSILEGDGSTVTILKPFNSAVAIINWDFIEGSWPYHSEIKYIGFQGASTKTGVGFTFAKTIPSDYETSDEYSRNVKFYGCWFNNLEKGVQFPFGNIGTEFYSCGFSSNKYGVYMLNNKFGGAMHAGNKYFYAGEMNSNDCAVYCNNTVDGFGAIIFDNTIIEQNKIGVYIYQENVTFVPVTFNSVWFESNGGGAQTVVIDSWSGTTRSNQTVTARTIIIDGSDGSFVFNNGSFGDLYLKATDTTVTINNSRVESDPGFGGGPAIIDAPNSSSVLMFNCFSGGGVIRGNSQICMTPPTIRQSVVGAGSTAASLRAFQIPSRSSKVTNYGPSRAMSASLTTAATTAGTFNLTGTVVSDGIIYSQCNEFTRAAFGSNEFTRLSSPDSAITTSAGYYVFTLDFKITQGDITFRVWDQSTANFASFSAPALNKWFTFAAIARSPGSQTLFLDFSGSNQTCTWRVSAYQIHRFDSYQQAQAFLVSGVFAEP